MWGNSFFLPHCRIFTLSLISIGKLLTDAVSCLKNQTTNPVIHRGLVYQLSHPITNCNISPCYFIDVNLAAQSVGCTTKTRSQCQNDCSPFVCLRLSLSLKSLIPEGAGLNSEGRHILPPWLSSSLDMSGRGLSLTPALSFFFPVLHSSAFTPSHRASSSKVRVPHNSVILHPWISLPSLFPWIISELR